MFNSSMKKLISIALAFIMLISTCIVPGFGSVAEAAGGEMDFADGQYYIEISKSGLYVGLNSTELGSTPIVTKEPYLWNLTHRNGHIQLAPASRPDLTLEVKNSSLNEWGADVQILPKR